NVLYNTYRYRVEANLRPVRKFKKMSYRKRANIARIRSKILALAVIELELKNDTDFSSVNSIINDWKGGER
ncbi:hypothetical protein, partial [uncultured Prevotella sp.]|uniref:hypothetical protein n=1 Tax=uncultured Prevotella sp. TaxID=159272 RepID=UPI0027E2D9EE